ncbi:hypothetical protein KUV75_07640 [Qipengyuania gaetbuli]|uniref:hypothetical protein n=1 Tax=Qipengyuania gaetbuli TaxID=266952 RepID=UPI001C994E2B|nr:hypothetical protein [Qipengyuania gaetbuli]MBY6014771.1 hypothetical protein [Qipengyuania gaetbuli]
MTKTRHMLTSAPLAIAAMAALPLFPASAQEQPVIVLPDTAPTTTTSVPAATATPAPVIVLPDPEPVTTLPANEAAPTDSATREAAPAPVVASRATPAREVSRRVVNAVAATPVESNSEPATSEEIAPLPAPSAETIAANRAALEPVPAPVEDASSAALLLALLGVGGVGLAAFFLMRRRRKEPVPTIERPHVANATVASPPVLDRDPVVTTHDAAPSATVIAPAIPTRAAALSNGAAVELPREAPNTFAERDSLLKRMIAARPDRANPFRSPKARAKRARLILQSLNMNFHDRKPWIDLSQYTNIWPELRGHGPRTATA